MNLFDLGGQYLRVGRAITPPDSRGNTGMSNTPTAMPSASAVAAAAATAKIQVGSVWLVVLLLTVFLLQAMEAVATNIGVDASKLVPEKKAEPRRKRSRSRERERESRSPRKERKASPVRPVKTEPSPPAPAPVQVKEPEQETNGGGTEAAPAIQPPPTIPAESFSQPKLAGAADAQSRAQQVELEKKLMDQGEPATLKQQEDMSIKGKSARQMVMQRLMGSRARVESVVLLLKNMVSHEDVDEELQTEIEEECNRYGKVGSQLLITKIKVCNLFPFSGSKCDNLPRETERGGGRGGSRQNIRRVL